MREVSVRELKQSLSETLRAVGRGEQVRVTLRGRPLADTVPAGAAAVDDRLRELVASDRVVPPVRARPQRPPRLVEVTLQRLVAGALRAGRRALRLYLDASALVKRYVAESGSEIVRDAMAEAEGWYMCRAGSSRPVRAVGLAAGERVTRTVEAEWPAFSVVENDQPLVERAAALALERDLRSLDALHLAAALVRRGAGPDPGEAQLSAAEGLTL